jgi:predicted nucleotidyltransferase
MKPPKPDPELNSILDELVRSVQNILDSEFIGAYLQGSFAVGEWDSDRDVDFLVVVEEDVDERERATLQRMHGRLYGLPSHWAQHLEGSYVPRKILKREDPKRTEFLYLDNTHRALIRSAHDCTLVVRWVMQECGIPLAGLDPQGLVDPVPDEHLCREIRSTMCKSSEEIIHGRFTIDNRWAQPDVVLSYCRMLHILETGRIASKGAAARWARLALDPTWMGRPGPSLRFRRRADPDEFRQTLEFVRQEVAIALRCEPDPRPGMDFPNGSTG